MPKSTRQFLFPDINVWIALIHQGHSHHTLALQWFESLNDSCRIFFCRFTQMGFLRLLTNESVMGKDVVRTQQQAWQIYDTLAEDDRIELLAEPVEIESAFREYTQGARPAAKDWADSYLAAFAGAANLTLVTFDQAFSARGAEFIILKT